jgi:hypothetical protein
MLKFTLPVLLSDHFTMPVDDTTWGGYDYIEIPKQGQTPSRQQASFKNFKKSMVGKTDYAAALEKTYGVYLLAFDLPTPNLYIGIAASSSSAPEGVASRIRKHRIKATGTNVGTHFKNVGGVHHPEKWRVFAKDRAKYFASKNMLDDCSDMRLSVGVLTNDKGITEESQPRADLEYFEHIIFSNTYGVLDRICNKLWPNSDHVNILTSCTNKGDANEIEIEIESIQLWD